MNNIYNKKLLDKYFKSNMATMNDEYVIDDKQIDNRDEFDSIYLNTNDYEKDKNIVFVIINISNNRYCVAYPRENSKVKIGHVMLNKLLLNSIGGICDELKIYKLNENNVVILNDIKKQSFKDLKDEIVTLNPKYSYLSNLDADFFILKNKTQNCRLIVSKEHVRYSDAVKDFSIRLNRKQRIALGILDSDTGYICSKAEELILYPYPSINYDRLSILAWIKDRILQTFVGKVNIGLISKRTYQSDETFNIVRMSGDVMKLLGVGDTDIVKITYCYTSCYCRVLPISDKDKIIEQNSELGSEKIFEIENIIGIPANIRNELGISSVKPNISVKVERDMSYLFKKNINKQILPIILILFSTEVFVNGRELFIKIIIALISLPITLYFNLSSERSICK